MRRLHPVPTDTPPGAPDGPPDGPPAATEPGAAAPSDPSAASSADRGPGAGQAGPGEWSLDALADAYAYPPEASGPGGWLRGNMVSSLDGAAHHHGRSQPLSSPADMRIFGVLRGLADAVVVGAETVRREGYRPARARDAFAQRRAAAGQYPAPVIAVVTASLDLDFQAPLFTAPVAPTVLVTGGAAPEERVRAARAAGAEVVFAGEGAGADPERLRGTLAARGLRRLLTEGGPTLLTELVAAGALDELCLTLAPRIVAGDAPRVVTGPWLAVPQELTLQSVLEQDGFLFTRYRRV